MTHTHPVQPYIPVALDDQWSILNQLYQLALDTSTSHEEIETTWDIVSQEEHPNIVACLPPRNRDVWEARIILNFLQGSSY